MQPIVSTDEEIISLIRQARTMERGFRLLVEKYQERLYRHIRRLVLDHDDTNDVIQNCFIKVYRHIGKFEGQSALYTWLYRIATNEALTFLKRKNKQAATSLDDHDHPVGKQLRADPFFDGNETQLHLQEALSRLPEKQRIVFNLRYFEEMPYQDMSDILDTSVGALKASYHHAVKKVESYFRAIEI